MKACVILNPAAGPVDFHRQLNKGIQSLEELGWQVEQSRTTKQGDATRFAREAAENDFDVAIAVGGDGTINEVANGLAHSRTALGVIPAGTANVYAADVGIPIWSPLRLNAVRAAAKIIHTGTRTTLDMGRVTFANGEERYFFMWCGIGFDAAVTQEVNRDDVRRLGVIAWAIAGVMVAINYMGYGSHVIIDGERERRRLLWALFSNGQLYGRLWRIAPYAKMDDGLLDLTVFEGYDVLSTARHLVSLTFGQYARDPSMHIYRGKSFAVDTRKPLPVHVDSEPAGTTPIQVEIVPQALNVILPSKLPGHLLYGHDTKPGRRGGVG